MSDTDFAAIRDQCERRKIEFMSTPFDYPSLDLLAHRVRVKRMKSPSGEITNGPFLLAMARTELPIILSTGMANLDEIGDALAVLAFGYTTKREPTGLDEMRAVFATSAGRDALAGKVSILHCTSAYPAPASDLNLRAMATIADHFGLPVGYSDHSDGLHVSLAAVALGPVAIEKHFTLDRNQPVRTTRHRSSRVTSKSWSARSARSPQPSAGLRKLQPPASAIRWPWRGAVWSRSPIFALAPD